MSKPLTDTLHEVEIGVDDTLANPTPHFLVDFPYEVSFTIPTDGNVTKLTVTTRSETICSGDDEEEVRQELKVHQPDFNTFYVERLFRWLGKNIENVNPAYASVSYWDDYKISPMTQDEVIAFKGDCTDDE
jgi:hypothetical protein